MKATSADSKGLLSRLPAVGILLQHPELRELCARYPAGYVHNRVRRALDELRRQVTDGEVKGAEQLPSPEELVRRVRDAVEAGLGNRLMRAVNAAGVILHTGLGRAPLAPSAQQALMEAASRYCVLAAEQETGKRGDRHRHNDELLRELTGAESSLVVNNNAAAVMLALNTFGLGRESVISRGELVEIGGMFRMPDVMRRSGTVMVEVGTTNKTHQRDYLEAITERTGLLVKVHNSNFRIEGFHKEVLVRELAQVVAERSLILLFDIGSGALVDLRRWGLDYEPTVPEAVADGADIVTFSGDKLLGGPQCGVIVGKRALVERMKRNPLMRAIRPDKLTLAALNGTLRLFLEPDRLPETHPIYAMMTAPLETVNRRARKLARRLREVSAGICTVSVEDGRSEMGSGSLPARSIPSRVVALKPLKGPAEALGKALRMAKPPVFSRIEDDAVMLDARTIAEEEVAMVAQSLRQALKMETA